MLIDTSNLYTVTDLRRKTAQILKRVSSSKEPAAILSQGKPKVAIIDIKLLEKIQSLLEEYEDYLLAKKASEKYKKSDYLELDKFWEKFSLAK